MLFTKKDAYSMLVIFHSLIAHKMVFILLIWMHSKSNIIWFCVIKQTMMQQDLFSYVKFHNLIWFGRHFDIDVFRKRSIAKWNYLWNKYCFMRRNKNTKYVIWWLVELLPHIGTELSTFNIIQFAPDRIVRK